MVQRPAGLGILEFTVMAGLRSAQLVRGCVPLVEVGTHKKTTTALMEVASRKIQRVVLEIAEPVAVVAEPA
jgi:DNA-directed RNA polymerase subunit K/omega